MNTALQNALNQTGLPTPTGGPFAPYPYFTQEDVFSSSCVRSLPTHLPQQPFSAAFLAAHGATLDEWRSYVQCFANATATHASGSSVAALRAALSAALVASPPRYIGVNYHRTTLGQVGGGHMSPLAAYDPATDLALILDVARYRSSVLQGYGPVWVPIAALFAAMNTTDSDSGVSRGWLEVSAPRGGNAAPPLAPAPPPFNMTTGRSCLSSLVDPNDLDGVEKCMRGSAPAPAPPVPASCAPLAAPKSGAPDGLAAVTFLLAVSTTGLGALYWRERKRNVQLAKATGSERGSAVAMGMQSY